MSTIIGMDITYIVLETLWQDVQQLVLLLLVTVPVAGVMCAAAAAGNKPTLWRDFPGGLFWGWMAAMAAAVTFSCATAFTVGFIHRAYDSNNWRVLEIYALCIFGPVCLFTCYWVAGAWFRYKIKQRRIRQELGLPDQPYRWSAISLRTLLLIQLGVFFTIGGWYSANRSSIEYRYRWKQRLAWQETVHARFDGYGWHLRKMWHPLTLCSTGPLVNFNDQVLTKLQPDDQLKKLCVNSDQLTNVGMQTIAEQTNLTDLRIKSASITDAGVAQLAKLPQLEFLTLDCPLLTDAVLVELQKCPKLKGVIIAHPKISREAFAAYRAAKPNVGISVNHPWPPVMKPAAPLPAAIPSRP